MRFCSFRKARRAAPSSTHRSSRRLLLESLEDRVVPSIAEGTILVATGPSSFSSQDQSSFPIGIIGVDPKTGVQSRISTGGLFAVPTYIAEAPNQQLYITDITAFGTGAIIQVDPNSGQQKLVAKGGFINGPNVLAFVNGYIYVADLGNSSGTVHNIVQIDPSTGQQRLITDGSSGGFTVPVGIVPAPGNSVYVADEPGNVGGTDPGAIWQVNLDTGEQTLISRGGIFNHTIDVAVEASGNLIVGNTGNAGNSYAGSLVRVNPQTGAQTLVSSFGADTGLNSIDVARNGTIFVGAISTGSTPGRIYAVNPVTGSQAGLTSDGNLSLVEGIRAFHVTASSSTALVSSGNSSVSGQTVTFTATVNVTGPGNPTGTVTFLDGSTSIGSAALATAGGVTTASFNTATLSTATHSITAMYNGDSNFNISTSTPLTQTVSQGSTSTVVASVANPSVTGQSLTFTATETVIGPGSTAAASPTATVTFLDNGTSIGQGTLSTTGGKTTASFTTSSLVIGSHTITASYGGDSNFLGSTATLTQTVNQAATTLAVTPSANPSVSGQSVTFTATVTVSGPGSTAVASPTGTANFLDNGTSIGQGALSTTGGATTASFSTSSLAVGSHTITASYAGDSNFLTSTAALTQNVNQDATTTSITSSANTVVPGQTVTFTATISVQSPGASTPTGTVQFQINGSNVGSPVSVSTSGGVTTASFSTASLAAGKQTIVAVYSGDANCTSSTGTLTLNVNQSPTGTGVTSSAIPSVFGQSVTFTATVTTTGSTAVGNPTGVVIFSDGATSIGQGMLSTTGGTTTASFTTSGLAVGSHTLTASYAGDGNFLASIGTLTQTVNQASTATSTTSSVIASAFGQSLTFTATVAVSGPGSTAIGNPAGVVIFSDGARSLGQATLRTSTGTTTASFNTSSLAVGSHTITASYGGDSNFLASNGTLTQTVNQAATAMTVTSSAKASVSGQSVSFTAIVTVNGPGSTAVASPTGFVIFSDGAASIGQGPLSTTGGTTTASFSTSGLAVGSHILTASYAGDGSFLSSTGTVTQAVGKANTTSVLVLSANPSVAGQSETFAATVTVSGPGSTSLASPTGVVIFSDGGTSIGQATLNNAGGATTVNFSTSSLAVGSHIITASYGGDSNFLASTGTLTQVVNQAATTVTVNSSAKPSVSGQLVSFTAIVTVSGPGSPAVANPTGLVIFSDGGTSIGQATLSTTGATTAASFSTSSLAVGSHTITAFYGGDSSFLASSGTVKQQVGNASTSTTVVSSVTPSVVGQAVTFTASVTISGLGSTAAASPTGLVTFSDGSTSIGQGALSTSSGTTTASFSTSSLAVGSHTITALYGGDSNFLGNTGMLTQTVNPTATTTAITSSSNLLVLGQSVTFTATISVQSPGAGTPAGTVQFQIDGSNVGSSVSVTTSGGLTTASFSTASLTVGTHTITASYSDDGSFGTSSATLTGGQTVNKASTSTAVSSSVNPSVSGQSVALMATISVPPGAGTPTGTVQFQIDGSNAGSPVTISTAASLTTASFSTASLPVGAHTITASYSGDTSFTSSSAAQKGQQVVVKASTNTTAASSVTPSVSGQTVVLTATVTVSGQGSTAVARPTGMVIFFDGATSLGQGTLSTSGGTMTANFSTSGLIVGSHAITASYAGDSNFLASTTALTQTVGKASTSTMVVSSASPTAWGQSETFTATVTVNGPGSMVLASPSGVVIFSDGATSIGQGTLSTTGGTTTANFSTSGLKVGSHAISASYAGDSNFLTSTNTLIQTVNQASTSTILLISASVVPSGQALVLTATVSSGTLSSATETGSVAFLDQGTPLATVPLSEGTAVFLTSTLSLGEHSLSAAYLGDPNHTASNSSALTVTVGTPNERFVGGLYQSLLLRQPDAAGLAAWTAALNQGVSRTQVALAIEQSLESRTDQVQALYHQFLHRSADPSGLNTFVTFLGAGGTLEQVSAILTSSPEYLQVRGGGTNDGFLTALYEDALSRSPDAGGLAGFTQALNLGASRQQVAAAILGSTEYLRDLVATFYELFLKRAADEGGLNSFVQDLAAGVPDQQIVAALLGSDEFFSQV